MADSGQKTGFRLVGSLGNAFGFGQRLVQFRQFTGSLGDALFQAFVGLGERLFGLTERGNVGKTHDEPAARHGVADKLDHPAIGEQAFRGVRPTLAHPVQAARHVHFCLTGAAQAAFGVMANNVGNRAANADQPLRIVEQFQVAAVPGHEPQGLVDHADALGDVFDCALEQGTVELQHF